MAKEPEENPNEIKFNNLSELAEFQNAYKVISMLLSGVFDSDKTLFDVNIDVTETNTVGFKWKRQQFIMFLKAEQKRLLDLLGQNGINVDDELYYNSKVDVNHVKKLKEDPVKDPVKEPVTEVVIQEIE